MPPLKSFEPFEIAVVFWAGGDPAQSIAEYTRRGIRCGQLVIPGDLDLNRAPEWKAALSEADFTIYNVLAAFNGESYADIPAVARTVGFVPQSTRTEREQRMLGVSDFAARIGSPAVGTHIGFVPADPRDPDYIAMRELVRRVCDHAAKHGQTFTLETGQEPADALLDFLHDAGRDNLSINFDPANMILYGTGDPIEALGILGEHVFSVHCKDGDWPDKSVPGALGIERPLGQGAVGIERFLNQLRHVGYKGPLAIERETEDAEQRLRDIDRAIALLERLRR